MADGLATEGTVLVAATRMVGETTRVLVAVAARALVAVEGGRAVKEERAVAVRGKATVALGVAVFVGGAAWLEACALALRGVTKVLSALS